MPFIMTSLSYLSWLRFGRSIKYKLLNTFEFTKAVSDTVLSIINDRVFVMINAAYNDKPLMFYRDYILGEYRLPSLGS